MRSRGFNLYSPLGQRASKALLFSILVGFAQMVFALAPFMDTPAQAATSNFSYSTSIQYFTVPESVYSITITMYGGGGGIGGHDCSSNSGFNSTGMGTPGYIGKITGTISVRPGDTLTIAIGGGGVNGQSSVNAIGSGSQGGTNPIASAGSTSAYNGGGGGAAGGSGTSGSGGGGGAATVLHVAGHGYFIAAGAGGSGGDNCAGLKDADVNSAVPSAVSTRTRTDNGTNLNGATGGSTSASVDGGGSGGGGGGFTGGGQTNPAQISSTETYGYGGSAGTDTVAATAADRSALTAQMAAPATQVTSGCHYTGSTAWSNYGCGADGSVSILYAPTPTLSQTDQNNASVQSTEVGTVYLVNETVSVSSLTDITNAPSTLKTSVAITTANSPTNISLSGLSPGTYVAYAYSSASSSLSSASRTTVAAGGMCTFTNASGIVFSNAYRLGYCFVTFTSGSGSWTVPSGVTNVSLLAVGGGGGGGENGASGGGGGALQDISNYRVTSGGTVSVAVGAGGIGGSTTGTSSAAGSSGSASSFGTVSANGGGGGNSTGGSGGVGGVGGSGGTSIGGVGGAGASSAGATPSTAGNGASSLILGLSNYYAGGGAGGDWQYGIGTAGTGGGWSGIELQQHATYNNALANAGGNGFPNTGGGGGGGGATYGYGGSGGSGVVVVRYIATSFKQTGPGDTTMYVGDSATLTTTAPNLFSGITRTIKWQVSFDTGTTWTNVDSGTLGLTSTYQTPIETNTSLSYWFRAAITDTTTTYSFATYTDTGTLIFQLRPSNDTDTALYFNGSQVMKTRSVVYSDSAGGSIEVWVKPAVGSCAAASNQTVIYKANTFQIYCRSGLWYGFTSTGTNAAGTISFSGMPVRTGEWTHLAITFDGTKLVGYYNGQATEIQSVNNASANVPTPWLVGGTGSANEYFTGQIDDLKIWNNYRVETQVAIDMDTYTSSNAAGLTAHYDFNEGSGNGVYNRDYPYDSGATDLFPYVGSATYSWNAIESSSVSGNYKTVQIPRTILTASGGWKIPTQVNTTMALLVGGGGGGGVNAGGGGAGGGGVKAIAATRATLSPLRIKVGAGGIPGLTTDVTSTGQSGLSTAVATIDTTVVASVSGGAGGWAHWAVGPCISGSSPQTSTISGGGTTSSLGLSAITSSAGGNGGAIAGASGSAGQAGGAGFTSTTFNGTHLFGGGGGSGGWGNSTVGGYGGGDSNSPKGGNGGGASATSGEAGIANTGNGGGGAGNNGCSTIASQGGSGTVYLKFLTLDTVTVTGPNNDTTTAGSKYTFKISATTPNAALTRSYQWQFSSDSGSTWTNLTTGVGYDSNTYTTATLDNTTSGSQFQYHCLVIDSDTNGISIFATSNNAYLTMNGAPTISGAATITTTYGTQTSSSYTPLLGTPTRTFTMLPGTYGGVRDPSFNGLGYETSTFTQGNSYANAVAFSPDGGIIVGGQTYSGYDNFSLVKYKSSGAVDTSFGTNGLVLTNMGISSVITALTIDSSTGKITAVGQAAGVGGNDGRIGVARYLASGLLDTTFAAIGYETITIPNSTSSGNYVSGVVMQSDGKILISASRLNISGTDSATILRLTTTGSLDSGFGSGGYAEFAWGAGYNYSVDIALQSDGKILLAGREQDTNSNGLAQFAATRLNANGAIDATYGTSGTTIFPAPCSGYCLAEINAQIASDNSIYFIGTTNASPYNVYTAHLNAGGSRDSLWGGSGFTTETVTAVCTSPSIAINSAQQIAASCTYSSTNFYSPIYLYDSTGTRVPTFGSAGVALINMPVSTGLSPKSQLSGRPANQFFNIDASDNYYLVGMQGNNYAVMKIAGNNISTTLQSTSITLDTRTLEVGKIVVDTFTPAGTYLQTLVVTDSSSVSGYKIVTITVNKAPGVTITASPASGAYAYVGDTATFFETVTTSGLIAGDTVSVTFSAKAPSSNTLTAVKVVGDTYTIAPVTADTFTITPSITSISHGSVSNGQLSNYLSTTYVAGLTRINRGTRTGFAINSSSGFAYAYVGAPLQLSVMNTRDTGTVSFTVSGANCVLDTTTLLLSDTATSNATCIVTATIARTTNWETATAQTTFYFQAYVNYYPSPADGTGPTIALSGQVAITIVAGAPTITGALVYSYDSTAAVVFTITGTGFGSLASAVQVKIGRKLGTITAISDTSITVNFSVPTFGDNVNWGRLSVATPVAVASIPTEYISGQPWRYSTQVIANA